MDWKRSANRLAGIVVLCGILLGLYSLFSERNGPVIIEKFQRVLDTKDIELFPHHWAKCQKWYLSEKDILQVLSTLKPISGPAWHHMCLDFNCAYEGGVEISGNTYNVHINAGGWAVIFRDGESIYNLVNADVGFIEECEFFDG